MTKFAEYVVRCGVSFYLIKNVLALYVFDISPGITSSLKSYQILPARLPVLKDSWLF